jgi:hypothetical protein
MLAIQEGKMRELNGQVRKSLLSLAASLFAAAVVFLSMAPVAYGQGITTGTITGNVVDPSGAAIPNAQVTATSNSQGTKRQTTSGSAGEFSLFAVPIGQYTLTISASGFASATVNSVQVNAGATAGLKAIKLSLAASTAQVEVNGSAAALLETSDSQVTTTFDSQAVQNIPLNNGFDTITEVIPGVTSTHGDNFSNTNGDNFSVNGQSGRNNNFEIDGQANNDNSVAGPQIFFGSQDAIQEIQVITNSYSAQYGRNAGAVVNYITKSGSNGLHGSGFEFYQGDMLASLSNQEKNPLFGYCAPGQNPSSGCAAAVVPRYVENRYGGTIGGPAIKDKLFFFGSTYWDKLLTGVVPSESLPALTPTPAGIQQLQSAFPGNAAVAGLAKYGPYGLATGNPQPIGTPVLETVVGPNGTSATIPFSGVTRSIGTPFNDQEELGRLDWAPTAKDHLFLRYFYQNQLSQGISGGDIAAGDFVNVPGITHSVGADWTRAFSPRWVDQLRYSFQQSKIFFQGGAYPSCTATNLGSCPTFIDFVGSNDESLGVNAAFPQGRTVKVTQIQDNATWTRGNHTLLFGGEFDYQNSPNIFLPLYNGQYLYSNFSSFLSDSGALLLADGNPVIPFTEPDAAGYVQDDWKVSPTFTAHIGLRWEYFGQAVNKLHSETVARESNPATAFFSPSLPLSERTVPAVAEVYKNFEPRIGFAWNPTFDKGLVVSGGYAINANPAFYNIFELDAIATPVAISQELQCAQNCQPAGGNFTGGGVRAQNLSGLSFGGDPRFDDQTYVPPNFRTPYVQTYTLALQHQVGHSAVVSIRYVGSKTTQNFQSVNENPNLAPVAAAFPNYVNPASLCQTATDPGFGRPNCDRANLAYVSNGGWANYQALGLNVTTQKDHGLTGTLSYTYSRNVDNVTDVFSSTNGAGSSVAFSQNPLDPNRGESGVDGNSYPNTVGAGFVYNFPQIAHSSRLVRDVVNGFNLSSVYRFSSGQPYTAVQPLTLDANTGDTSFCDGTFNSSSVGPATDTCRLVLSNPRAPLNTVAYLNPYTGPVVNGAPTPGNPVYVNYASDSLITDPNSGIVTGYNPGTPVSPTSSHWIINNQAYALSVGNPYPGVGRNTLRGQSFSDLDLSIYKTVPVTERVSIQLSLSTYNALNQMYRNPPEIAVQDYSPTGFNDFLSNAESLSGSIPGDSAGNRIVIIGGKVVF